VYQLKQESIVSMPRLPVPGSDDDVWGSVLNDFLEVAHNNDGSLQTSAVQQAGAITSINGKTPSGGQVILGATDIGALSQITLAEATDVDLTNPINNQVLTYDATTDKWINQTNPSGVSLDSISGDIQMDGAQTAGSTGKAADAGHIHPTDTSRAQAFIATAVQTYTSSPITALAGQFIPVDTTNGNVIVMLPTVPTNGSRVEIKMVKQAGTNTVTINTGSGDTFNDDNTLSVTLKLLNQAAMLQYSLSARVWYVQSDDLPLSQLDGRYLSQLGAGSSGGTATLDSGGHVPAGEMRPFNYRGTPASSTTYNPWDVLIYRGGRILITTSFTTGTIATGSFPVISASNYVTIGSVGASTIMASDYGIVADGTTDNGSALNSLIQEVSANGGGNIYLPSGVTTTSIPIVLRTSVHLWGNGFWSSELRLLANSNCDVVQFYTSPDGVQSNAFFCGLWNLEINGDVANQAPGDFHYGINLTTNPINSAATDDPYFDTTHIICNVHIALTSGHGYYALNSRNGTRLMGVWAQSVGGHGFVSGTDTEYIGCHAETAGLGGWFISHSSAKGTANKSYNNGHAAVWTSGNNYSSGAYAIDTSSGNLYRALRALTNDTVTPSSDTSNWTNVSSATGAGYGWYFSGPTSYESAWSGCDAQQNATGGIYLYSTSAIVFQGTISQVNTGLGVAGNNNQPSNPNNYSAVTLDGSSACIISVATQQLQYGYVFRLINSSTHNDVILTGDGTAAATLSPDSTTPLGSGN
jgi:hypothetical protein